MNNNQVECAIYQKTGSKNFIWKIHTGTAGKADPGKADTAGDGGTGTAADPGSTGTAANGRLGRDAPGTTVPGNTATAPGKAEPRTRLDGGIMSIGSTGGTGFFSRAR